MFYNSVPGWTGLQKNIIQCPVGPVFKVGYTASLSWGSMMGSCLYLMFFNSVPGWAGLQKKKKGRSSIKKSQSREQNSNFLKNMNLCEKVQSCQSFGVFFSKTCFLHFLFCFRKKFLRS